MKGKCSRFMVALSIAGLVASGCEAQPASEDSTPPTRATASSDSEATSGAESLEVEAETLLLEEWDVGAISDRCKAADDWQCGFESFASEGTGDSLIVYLRNVQDFANGAGLASEVANELRASLQPSIDRLRQITVYVDGKPQASAYRLPD